MDETDMSGMTDMTDMALKFAQHVGMSFLTLVVIILLGYILEISADTIICLLSPLGIDDVTKNSLAFFFNSAWATADQLLGVPSDPPREISILDNQPDTI
ncbi:unnamed protein product [Meganyctiphanes norvegica]|uniref:Uncharacterized protein n=1 Tax=Meganyctiphanes norvegica TaxID=48144 RepID=A0AAV2SNE2_MEGNR